MAICTSTRPISPPPTSPNATGFAEAPVAWLSYVREGLPLSVVDQAVADGRITAVGLDRLALSRKTLAHRRSLGALTPDQSDRLSRLPRATEDGWNHLW